MELDAQTLISLVSRWAHILSAIAAVGGTIFMRVAWIPASASLSNEQRASLEAAIRARWARVVHASILFLLASGLYNIVMNFRDYKLPPQYHGLFGVKFLLALAIFFIASMLTGRSEASARFRQNAKRWLTVNVVLATLLVCISGVLRALPHDPKAPGEATKAEAAPPAVQP